MKNKLVPAGICILILAAIWWIYQGPRKSVTKKIQWSIDEETKKEVPIFLFHYKWDEIEEKDPTWMIFPKEGKWWVIDLREVMRSYSEIKSESELPDLLRKYRQEFTIDWINNRRFQPRGSRYEVVMTALGFNMLFGDERDAFHDFLKGTKDFGKGHLYPNNINRMRMK